MLVMGGLFRLLHPTNVPFGFDQVQILENAQQILSGDLTLIGPRTGPANMFTGPLIYYLGAPLVWIVGDVTTVWLLPVLLAFSTGLALYLTVRTYVSHRHALLVLMIWAFSPFLISLDRVLWNPNITVLASVLLFFPLLPTKTLHTHSPKLRALVLFVGAFLAYQAHFAGLLLILLALVSICCVFRATRQTVFYSMVVLSGLLISVGSLVLFDLRNDWLNARGFVALLTAEGETKLITLLRDFGNNIFILAETTGKLFAHSSSLPLLLSIGMLVLLGTLMWLRKLKSAQFAVHWLVLIAGAFAFYARSKPEYYFLIAIPALLYLSTELLTRLHKQALGIVLCLFLVTSTLFNVTQYAQSTGLTLGNQLKVRAHLADKSVASVVYDMPYGSDTGLTYLLRNLKFNNEGQVFHIAYPNDLEFSGVKRIASIGIWADRRPADKNSVMQRSYFITTNPDLLLLQNLYPKQDQAADEYVLLQNDRTVGTLAVVKDDEESISWVSNQCAERKKLAKGGWHHVSETQFIQHFAPFCVWLTLDSTASIAPTEISIH